jgi:hypothetical protein
MILRQLQKTQFNVSKFTPPTKPDDWVTDLRRLLDPDFEQ